MNPAAHFKKCCGIFICPLGEKSIKEGTGRQKRGWQQSDAERTKESAEAFWSIYINSPMRIFSIIFSYVRRYSQIGSGTEALYGANNSWGENRG